MTEPISGDAGAVLASSFWASPLVLVLAGAVVVFGFVWSTQLARRHGAALDRLAHLAEANSLLKSLHQLAGTLPVSLDHAQVLDTTLARAETLIDHDAAVILEPAGSTESNGLNGSWSVARQRAISLAGELEPGQLPEPSWRALTQNRVVKVDRFEPGTSGFGTDSRSAIYAPLTTRDRLVGLLGVESRQPAAFTSRDSEALAGFIEPVALAIDNARLFDRIRAVSADEERSRIARDLHDRIGQALAGVGFDLDRLARRAAAGQPVAAGLQLVRDELRSAVTEVRDALHDLRTEVTDARDLIETLHTFAAQVAERSNLTISIDADANRRPPILVERELWRITQEALVNVERHAEATEVSVLWRCDADRVLLEVVDNGRGLPTEMGTEQPGRPDSYGITGMRERASSIGATLELTSRPGEGTKVRCFLDLR